MKDEIEVQRELLNQIVKQLEKRIKQVQKERDLSFHQDDVWIKDGIQRELIGWKIHLQKWRKKLRYI
jgi:hypothetical protein